MKAATALCALLGLFLAACTPKSSSKKASSTSTIALPDHWVESNTQIWDGRRIEIRTQDTQLTKAQCKALIAVYIDQAKPHGQVSVRRPVPSGPLQGQMLPWCVDNLDGNGVTFNDFWLMQNTASSSQGDKSTAVKTIIRCSTLDIVGHLSANHILSISLRTDMPSNVPIGITISRSYWEVGSPTEYAPAYIYPGSNGDGVISSTVGAWRTSHSFKIDDKQWIDSVIKREAVDTHYVGKIAAEVTVDIMAGGRDDSNKGYFVKGCGRDEFNLGIVDMSRKFPSKVAPALAGSVMK